MKLLLIEAIDYEFNAKEYSVSIALLKLFTETIEKHLFGLLSEKLKNDDNKTLQITYKITNQTNDIKTEGPFYSKNKYRWLIQLPYNEINTASNKLNAYTQMFFNALKRVFMHYKIPQIEIEKQKEQIINNLNSSPAKYQYHQKEIENANYVRERRAEYLKKND